MAATLSPSSSCLWPALAGVTTPVLALGSADAPPPSRPPQTSEGRFSAGLTLYGCQLRILSHNQPSNEIRSAGGWQGIGSTSWCSPAPSPPDLPLGARRKEQPRLQSGSWRQAAEQDPEDRDCPSLRPPTTGSREAGTCRLVQETEQKATH